MRQQGGYALLVIMMMVTLLLVSLTVALPSVYIEGQREREEELIFRGYEYARAIALFRRQFRRFPTSVNELLRTNGIRFLRRPYRDPMSRDGKWRFIHADINGTLLDSKTQGPLGPAAGHAQNPSVLSKKQTPPGEAQGQTSGPGKEIQGAYIAGVASSSSGESIRIFNRRSRYDEWEFLGVEGVIGGLVPGTPSPGPPGSSGSPVTSPQPTTPIATPLSR